MGVPVFKSVERTFAEPSLQWANNGSASWVRGVVSPLDQKSPTGWLADLYGGSQTNDDWARVVIPVYEMFLTDFTKPTQWSYYMTGTQTMGVNIVLWVHDPNDYDKRAEITQLGSKVDYAAGWQAHELSTSTSQFFFYGEGTTGTSLTAGTQYTLAQFQADVLFKTWTIYRITMEYGWEASGTFDHAYLADLKLNGVNVWLRPTIGDPIGSEVKTLYVATSGTSTTKATAITPTTGKRIRMISVQAVSGSATAANFEVYFHTGANITTTAAKAIFLANLDTDTRPYESHIWPEGKGPLGAVNEVVSIRTSADITTNGYFVFTYKEE
jgi:hypothetical protein